MRSPDLALLIENSGENPLPNTLRVENLHLSEYQSFAILVERHQNILQYNRDTLNRRLVDFQSQFDRLSSVVSLLQIFQYILSLLLLFFSVTVGIILYYVLLQSISQFRQEIEIIGLV